MSITDSVSSVTHAVNTQAAGAATKSTAAAATNSLSYDDFITLLMTELQHQDPTQPMDPTQMVSQLATVSEVGQSVLTNKNLSQMLISNSLSQAELLVGQKVTSTDGKTSGTVASVEVSSTGTTATLTDGSKVPLATGATIQ
jgi:flagellar basal-body rod modification protein FlgD